MDKDINLDCKCPLCKGTGLLTLPNWSDVSNLSVQSYQQQYIQTNTGEYIPV